MVMCIAAAAAATLGCAAEATGEPSGSARDEAPSAVLQVDAESLPAHLDFHAKTMLLFRRKGCRGCAEVEAAFDTASQAVLDAGISLAAIDVGAGPAEQRAARSFGVVPSDRPAMVIVEKGSKPVVYSGEPTASAIVRELLSKRPAEAASGGGSIDGGLPWEVGAQRHALHVRENEGIGMTYAGEVVLLTAVGMQQWVRLQGDDPALVHFHDASCDVDADPDTPVTVCQRVAGAVNEAATILAGRSAPLQVGRVDLDEQPDLRERFGDVAAGQTAIMLKGQVQPVPRAPLFSGRELALAVEQLAPSPWEILGTSKQLREFIAKKTPEKPALVAFIDDPGMSMLEMERSSSEPPAMKLESPAASTALRATFARAVAQGPQHYRAAVATPGAARRLKGQIEADFANGGIGLFYPAALLSSSLPEASHAAAPLEQLVSGDGLEGGSLSAWLESARLLLVDHMRPDNYHWFDGEGGRLVAFFDVDLDDTGERRHSTAQHSIGFEDTHYWRDKLLRFARQYHERVDSGELDLSNSPMGPHKLKFAVADEEDWAFMMHRCGLGEVDSEVRVAILDDVELTRRWRMVTEFSEEELWRFVERFHRGRYPPYVMSEAVPRAELKHGRAGRIVGKNARTVVFNESLDVVVHVRATDCDRCDEVDDILDAVARHFAQDDSLRFATLDGSLNDLPVEFQVPDVPTIVIVPAVANAEPVTMSGATATARDVVKFVRKHAASQLHPPKTKKKKGKRRKKKRVAKREAHQEKPSDAAPPPSVEL